MSETYSDSVIRIRPSDSATDAYPVEAELEDGAMFVGGSCALTSTDSWLRNSIRRPTAWR
jgi:hypothetical protein